jgi:hypothetical protein
MACHGVAERSRVSIVTGEACRGLWSAVPGGFPAYRKIAGAHTHHAVNHSAGEYARKEGDFTVHTNTVESSFSQLKRGVIGTFHNISKKHLPLYLAEFDHRWNHRKVSDGERTVAGLVKARGKRLTYKAIKGN